MLTIFCGFLIYSTKAALLRNNMDYAEMMGRDFKSEVSVLASQMDSLFSLLQYNEATCELLSAPSHAEVTQELLKKVNAATASAKLINSAVADVAFVNGLLHWSSIYPQNDLLQLEQEMQGKYDVTCLGVRYTSSMVNRDNPYYVFGYNVYADFKLLGTIVVSLDFRSLSAKFPNGAATGTYFLLLDQDGAGHPVNTPPKTADSIRESAAAFLSPQKEEASSTRSLGTKDYAMRHIPLPEVEGALISAVDIRQIPQSLSMTYSISWIFLALCAISLLIASVMLYLSFVQPLNQFSRAIAFIREKKLRKLDKPLMLEGCSEIRIIGRDFTEMLSSINRLNEKIVHTSNALYETELQRKIAEISNLRSQINPHFLYNTLELIRASALSGDREATASATVSMGKIMRYSIKGDDIVPLYQEIDIVKAYVNIQQARFKNRITTLYSVTDQAQQMPVMKMLLQPLVENAFLHGLEPKPDGGLLYIGAMIDAGKLTVTIRDNGVGIGEERLAQLQNILATRAFNTSVHLGLVNIHARIQLQYGDGYGLSLSSQPNDGTCVTVSLPIL